MTSRLCRGCASGFSQEMPRAMKSWRTLCRRSTRSHLWILPALAAVCLAASAASGAETPKPAAPAKPAAPLPDLAKAHWIWAGPNPLVEGVPEVLFRKVLDLPSKPKSAVVLVTADNGYDLYVGESLVGGDAGFDAEYWQSVEKYDITALLAAGKNVLGVKGINMGGPAGLLLAARIELEDGTVIEIQSDKSWRTYLLPETAWSTAAYDDAAWLAVVDLGPLGMAPWGKLTYPGPVSPAHAGAASVGRLVEPGPTSSGPRGSSSCAAACRRPARRPSGGSASRAGTWSTTRRSRPSPGASSTASSRPGPTASSRASSTPGRAWSGRRARPSTGRPFTSRWPRRARAFFISTRSAPTARASGP